MTPESMSNEELAAELEASIEREQEAGAEDQGTLDACREAARRLRNPWRPMSTAPKDGTQILLYDKYRTYYAGNWSPDGWTTERSDLMYPDCEDYEGWTPLPAPPAKSEAEPS